MAYTTTFTRSDLVTKTLNKYRVVGEGQSGSAEQESYVDDAIDGSFDELARKKIVTLDANGSFPAGYMEGLADFMWTKVRTRFGRAPATYQEIVAAESALRAVDADGATFQTQRVDRW